MTEREMKLKLLSSIVAITTMAFALSAHADVAPPIPTPGETAANKAIVAELFQKMFVEGKIDEAVDKYVAPGFIEHDPGAKNGAKALKAYFDGYKKKNPKSVISIKRMIADGDTVLVHFHWQNNPADRGMAGVDIFRLVDGQVVEHWDVVQPVPEKSANDNTMF